MSFKKFFANQARKPRGWFGRVVMSRIFDLGNANLNKLVLQLISVQKDDQIFEIGYGTGKLISKLAKRIEGGQIQGVDFSDTMIAMASKRNQPHIKSGKVKLSLGDFDKTIIQADFFDKVCSVNTLYFWPDPKKTVNQIADILKPGGLLILAFEDRSQLEERSLDADVFNLYSKSEAKKLLVDTGRFNNVTTVSEKHGSAIIHCTMAFKL